MEWLWGFADIKKWTWLLDWWTNDLQNADSYTFKKRHSGSLVYVTVVLQYANKIDSVPSQCSILIWLQNWLKRKGGGTSGRFSISQFSLTTGQMARESIVVEGIDWFVWEPEERNWIKLTLFQKRKDWLLGYLSQPNTLWEVTQFFKIC